MQRKMVRFTLDLDFRSSVDLTHLSSLGWLTVHDRVRYFKLIHTHKIFNGNAPKYLSESFRNFSAFHSYNTRGSQTDYLISKEDSSRSIMLSTRPKQSGMVFYLVWNVLQSWELSSLSCVSIFLQGTSTHFTHRSCIFSLLFFLTSLTDFTTCEWFIYILWDINGNKWISIHFIDSSCVEDYCLFTVFLYQINQFQF